MATQEQKKCPRCDQPMDTKSTSKNDKGYHCRSCGVVIVNGTQIRG